MFLARVIGKVVATKKDDSMKGHRLLLLRPMLVDDKDPSKFRPGSNTVVAVDPIGAAHDEMVLFVQGSSARQADNLKALPVDAAIIGIVDSVNVLNQSIYQSSDEPDSQ
ncbi:MAG: ethanolamine utilization protein EutN/carboxysome structural protein Ccml [Puniceicoccaceae bacterium 5H]|nr:MAG: ethanolamine utilization protein EutN/carboxysome structural protein Ccml [Puniceicoccaceae bacterium 5H]